MGIEFVNVGVEAGIAHIGWGMLGVTVVDYNADGLSDVYLSNYGPNALYHNNGMGRLKTWLKTSALIMRAGVQRRPSGTMTATVISISISQITSTLTLVNAQADMRVSATGVVSMFFTGRGGCRNRYPLSQRGTAEWMAFTDATSDFGLEDHDYYGFCRSRWRL